MPISCPHELVFSHVYDSTKDEYGSIRKVDTGEYFAKIMGYDPVEVYGGDKELSAATLKDNKIPST